MVNVEPCVVNLEPAAVFWVGVLSMLALFVVNIKFSLVKWVGECSMFGRWSLCSELCRLNVNVGPCVGKSEFSVIICVGVVWSMSSLVWSMLGFL